MGDGSGCGCSRMASEQRSGMHNAAGASGSAPHKHKTGPELQARCTNWRPNYGASTLNCAKRNNNAAAVRRDGEDGLNDDALDEDGSDGARRVMKPPQPPQPPQPPPSAYATGVSPWPSSLSPAPPPDGRTFRHWKWDASSSRGAPRGAVPASHPSERPAQVAAHAAFRALQPFLNAQESAVLQRAFRTHPPLEVLNLVVRMTHVAVSRLRARLAGAESDALWNCAVGVSTPLSSVATGAVANGGAARVGGAAVTTSATNLHQHIDLPFSAPLPALVTPAHWDAWSAPSSTQSVLPSSQTPHLSASAFSTTPSFTPGPRL